MRELLSRLEKLEAKAVPIECPRIVWHVIDVLPGGGPAPFNPTVAYCPSADTQRLERQPEEAIDAFEARALAAFPVDLRVVVA